VYAKQDKGETAAFQFSCPLLVARPARCSYALRHDRVPLHPALQPRAKEVPAGDGWLHEVKFDGYRVEAHKKGSRVVIYSRNGRVAGAQASSVSLFDGRNRTTR
jgi:hypothetical protein